MGQGTKVFLKKKLRVEEKETKPPSRYTQASLLTAMETCGKTVSRQQKVRLSSRKVSEADLQLVMGAGIGTSATRANIIDKLLKQEWMAGDLESSLCHIFHRQLLQSAFSAFTKKSISLVRTPLKSPKARCLFGKRKCDQRVLLVGPRLCTRFAGRLSTRPTSRLYTQMRS